MEMALQFLLDHRYNEEYGLIWGATTADWGDVQPEHDWGVYLTDDTHYSLDIYDNAMMLIAIDNYISMVPEAMEKWQPIRIQISENVRKHLWDTENQKFFPHIYLNGSPFPKDFDENQVYYHGGTAVAIEGHMATFSDVDALSSYSFSGPFLVEGFIGSDMVIVKPDNSSSFPHIDRNPDACFENPPGGIS